MTVAEAPERVPSHLNEIRTELAATPFTRIVTISALQHAEGGRRTLIWSSPGVPRCGPTYSTGRRISSEEGSRGLEKVQVTREGSRPFDDVEVAREVLRASGYECEAAQAGAGS